MNELEIISLEMKGRSRSTGSRPIVWKLESANSRQSLGLGHREAFQVAVSESLRVSDNNNLCDRGGRTGTAQLAGLERRILGGGLVAALRQESHGPTRRGLKHLAHLSGTSAAGVGPIVCVVAAGTGACC